MENIFTDYMTISFSKTSQGMCSAKNTTCKKQFTKIKRHSFYGQMTLNDMLVVAQLLAGITWWTSQRSRQKGIP